MDQQNSAQPAPASSPTTPDANTAPAPVAPATAPAQPAATTAEQPPAAAPVPPTTTPTGTPPPPNAASAAAPATPAQPAPAKKSPMKLIIILIVLLLLAVGGYAAYQFMMPQKSSMTQSANREVSPTTAPVPTEGPVKSGDAKLDEQSDAIDKSMEKLNNDVENVDKGLQDQADTLQ
jgi:uncharacterized protein HemX